MQERDHLPNGIEGPGAAGTARVPLDRSPSPIEAPFGAIRARRTACVHRTRARTRQSFRADFTLKVVYKTLQVGDLRLQLGDKLLLHLQRADDLSYDIYISSCFKYIA